jgi:hypothetical protein
MASLFKVPFTVPACDDTVRPTVTITAPAEGATVAGTVPITVQAQDAGGLSRVELFVDGLKKSTDTSPPFSFAWNSTTVSDGTHTLTTRATDACGNTATSAPVDVTVDNVAPCQPGSGTLCLHGNRFAVQVSIQGQPAQAAPFSTTSGFFWNQEPENLEVAVKLLDARSVNGRFWAFHGSLTSLPYQLTVTDTQTGITRTFSKTASNLCGGADTTTFVGTTGLVPGDAAAGCEATATAACLLQDRFRVEVLRGTTPQRVTEVTAKTASFGFGLPTDPDVVVKALDGRPLNGHFWILFGALTDQPYQVVVTDTVTGASKTYPSPGALCGGGDISGF